MVYFKSYRTTQCLIQRSNHSLPWSEILPFRSVKIDLVSAWRGGWRPQEREDFTGLLHNHFQQWRGEGRSGVWLHLPLPLAHLANEAVAAGFRLHHISNEEMSIVLSAWLEDSASRLPRYATHYVGVSGIVYREDTQQILVVQDKYRFVHWKFPGGLAEHAEDIGDAAVREVREETGIYTEFRSVLAFRQHHHMPHYFDCSDLYFICRLHPLTFDLYPCEKEVVRCEWMNIHELATSQEATLLTQQMAGLIINNHNDFSEVDITMETLPSVYKGQTYSLFLRRPLNPL